MNNLRRVALHNLGCKVNSYETEAMSKLFQEAGYQVVPFTEQADVYVINTCTVTNMADRKSRQTLHRAKHLNPDAIVAAVGCYVQADQAAVEADPAIDLVIGNNQKKDIVAVVTEFLDQRREEAETISRVININQTKEYEELVIDRTMEHTRAYIKVQDGCNQFCSYCLIPYVRGRVRSRQPEAVYEEVCKLVENGYKEVVLTGIHLSSYGVDFQGDEKVTDLLGLITMVHDIPGLERIRLGSLEPRIITEEFAKALSEMPEVCPHFHLSMQSGCDETLTRMRRQYTTAEYDEKCQILRKYFKHPAITTDVITGFPGETEEEFAQTVKFVEHIDFYQTHIFKYSKRKGTKAAVMPNQVPEPVKTARSNVLLELHQRQTKKYLEHWVGTTVPVLFEERVEHHGVTYFCGHTPEYCTVYVETNEDLSNQILNVSVEGVFEETMLLGVVF